MRGDIRGEKRARLIAGKNAGREGGTPRAKNGRAGKPTHR